MPALVCFFIYLLCAPHDCKGLCVVCCARAYNTQSSGPAVSPPPPLPPTPPPTMLQISPIYFVTIFPQTRYHPWDNFMKWNPILVLKKEVPYQSLLSIHHLMQFNNRFRTSWWHIYKIERATKDLLICNVFAKHSMNIKAFGDTASTSSQPSTDLKF